MSNNKEKRVPKFCVDTNEIYFLSELVCNDEPFYIEAIDSDNYRYIADPIKEFPRLKIFEQQNDFNSPEYQEYTGQMRIKRTTIKELLDSELLFPEMFIGVEREKLPKLINHSFLGYFYESEIFNRPTYDRLYHYNYVLKCLREGKVNLFITETTVEEVHDAIFGKNITSIKEFMNLSLIKPIMFRDLKKYNKFLRKVDVSLKKYNRNRLINSIHKRGDNDLTIFAESSNLMLDLVSENTTHFISQNRATNGKTTEISDEFQKSNFENGCFYYSKINDESFVAVAPRILTIVDMIKCIKENEMTSESLRGLQEIEVTPSGIIW